MLEFNEGYFEEETREGFVISSMMKRAWAAQLEVLEEIRRVCELLDLSYFADWGTMLGAVRHQGFIPWDDDLDVGMLRADYEVFLAKAPKLLQHWYELKSVGSDPGHDIVKARLINGRHMNFEESFLEKFHHCPYVVGIDIFPVDNLPDQEEERESLRDALGLLLRVEASVPEEPPYGEDVLELMKDLERTFGIPVRWENRLGHEAKRMFDILSARYVSQPTEYVTCMLAQAAGRKEYCCKREWYGSFLDMPFENTTIPVPVGYDGILRLNYGDDYMTPKNMGSSHDYPFYKEQMLGLKEVMEQEFSTSLTEEQMELLIQAKVFG